MKLNNETALKQALELTKLAIENDVIPKYGDAKDAAEAVCVFCDILYEHFTSDSKN